MGLAYRCPQKRCARVKPNSAERRKLLLKYVKEVQPALIEQFVERGPPAVVAAMKNTITNMLGTLPPQFFTVTINTVGENLSQLMLSVCMTGYMFRNVQYRLELRDALGAMTPAAAAAVAAQTTQLDVYTSSAAMQAYSALERSQSAPVQSSVLDAEQYAPGVQKSRVQAGHGSHGPAGSLLVLEETANELLDYLRCLDASSLAELTSSAGPEVTEAMDSFVGRLMGSSDSDSLRRAGSECCAQELAKVMFWLMVVGYTLRGMEVRWDMQRSVQSSGAGGLGVQGMKGGFGRMGWGGNGSGNSKDISQDVW
eukprot:gene5360-5596_t